MQEAAVIREMLAHPDELQKMRENARQIAITKYSWQVEEQTLLRVYQKATGKHE